MRQTLAIIFLFLSWAFFQSPAYCEAESEKYTESKPAVERPALRDNAVTGRAAEARPGFLRLEELAVLKNLRIGENTIYIGEHQEGDPNSIFTDNGALFIQSHADHDNHTIFHANNSGNIGIGTENPDARFKIKARSAVIIGPTTFPDIFDIELNIDDLFGPRTVHPITVSGSSGAVRVGTALTLTQTMQIRNSRGINFWAGPKNTTRLLFRPESGGGADLAAIEFNHRNDRMSFKVNGLSTADLLINGDGKVGIGTTNLQTRLVVGGVVSTTRVDNQENYRVGNDAGIWDVNRANTVGILGNDPQIGKLQLGAGGATLTGKGKRIGINVDGANPDYTLDVRGRISNGGSDFVLGRHDGREQGSKTGNRALVHLDQAFSGQRRDLLGVNFAGDFEGGVQVQGERMIVGDEAPENNTSHQDYRLAVDGKVVAKEVVVTLTGWADDVFDEDYPLRSLADLEDYIDGHHHLPDVPAEREVLRDGVSLGEMDSILLRKIEELTLYVLDLDRELAGLRAENARLRRAANASLEATD